MKILHITPYYWPAVRYGGPVFSVMGLCTALAKKGHDVHVYSTNQDGPDALKATVNKPVVQNGVTVRYFASPTPFSRFFYSPSMAQAVAENIASFDIVHIHTCFSWTTGMASRIAIKSVVPYVFSPRGMLEKSLFTAKSTVAKWLWLYLIGKKVLRRAKSIHVTSQREQLDLEKFGIPTAKIKIVANGVTTPTKISDHKNQVLQPWQKQDYILALGRISWIKGLDRLISAWSFGIKPPLIIAGNDDETITSKLFAQARAEGVADKIHFIGPVDGEKKWLLLKNASLLVLPSHSENFGNVVLEAMAVGCPVITTPQVGAATIVENAKAGLVVTGKPLIISQAITELLADQYLHKSMSKRGIDHVKRYYTWDIIAGEMEELYLDNKSIKK
ncbi:MAG: glycosyltransferase [Magnetococcales bacterium]|nr:glycosyltransferase [Magnetococcales bacterium]